ncbi:hypothetical protein OV208_12165 [Corallococcus sp. bb12-1]|uniref:hypothetical protein n=1 Tax=Corallococcus sp. bb12-1 TaxID=2996784 RepID=UPI00227080C2|nr:hypothetical protein [Corallococcus sp. bb12-1]MCY1042072.1 hypothetical protein [Corallococcus sp. bb12-1]
MKHLYKCSVCTSEVWLDSENATHCAKPARPVINPGRFSYKSDKYRQSYVPLVIQADDTIKTLSSQYKRAAKASLKQLAYGQHLSCSGDRYGMFYALSLFKDASVAFFCAADKASVDKMLSFTEFYASGMEGLDCVGYKIVPILTHGDAEAAASKQFRILEAEFEKQSTLWLSLEGGFTARSELLQAKKLEHAASRPAQMDDDARKVFERRTDYIDEQIDTHQTRYDKAKKGYSAAKFKLAKLYWDTTQTQNRFAEELETRRYHAPFVWSNLDDFTWRGGNQLYSDASEPNNIARATGLSAVARLLQPHPELRVITIGKSHMHLNLLLEQVGGHRFAAATKFVGTTFLRNLGAQAVSSIEGEVNAWSRRIINNYRKQHPSSTATIKLLLVWVRGLNPTERRGVQGLKRKSGWDDDASVYQFSEHNHDTINADAKKNPHHVMNVQIFKQVSEICESISGKHTHVIPVAIGDILFEDMYDPQSPHYIDRTDPDHLVEYWERAPDALKGEASMLKQRTFLLALWKRFEIIQMGVRSGMLEFLAYNGLPTVYLERAVDCLDPESGAPRIKQLAYELEEFYSPSLTLPKLPWFRMQHQVNVGLSQYTKASRYNPKVLGPKSMTGVNESVMLGYFNQAEVKTLSLGLQNIFQSIWAKRIRAAVPEKIQFSMKDVESGEFGLLDDRYGAPPVPEPLARRVPAFEIEGWDPKTPNLVPDFLIARGVDHGALISVNGIEYRVRQSNGMKEPTHDNVMGKMLYATVHLRGG